MVELLVSPEFILVIAQNGASRSHAMIRRDFSADLVLIQMFLPPPPSDIIY